MSSSAQQLHSPVDFVVIDSVLDTTNNPVPPATTTTTTYAQKQPDRFATFKANRKEVEKARSAGFISKKDRLKPKGKFEVGSKKEVKVSDGRTVDIFVGNKGQHAREFVLKGMFLGMVGRGWGAAVMACRLLRAYRIHLDSFS